MRVPDVSIVVPTYREAENLTVLVPRLAAVLEQAQLSGEILIVDDNSPDETEQVCAELSARYPVRLLVRRTERGLSSAVLHGLRQATGTILLVMDADLSHPPEKVPELVGALQDRSTDFVIGSRYVAGGSVADDWGLFRWLNSRVATLIAWPLTSAADPMAGFFALRRERFEQAQQLDPIGYKIGLELLVKCGCKTVREVPIHFADRLHGTSKLTMREQLNYLRHVKRLYQHKLGRLSGPLQFGMIGLTGLVVDLTAFAVLLTFLSLPVARALAIWLAMTWNFWLNRRLTFSYARGGNVLRQYVLFALSCSVGALASWSTSLLLAGSSGWIAAHPLLVAAAGVVVGAGINYVLCAKAVFRLPRWRTTREPLVVSVPSPKRQQGRIATVPFAGASSS